MASYRSGFFSSRASGVVSASSDCFRDNRWRIAAGNIRNDAEQVVQALAAQGGRYVLETVSPEGEREYEEITSIQKLLPWQAGYSR